MNEFKVDRGFFNLLWFLRRFLEKFRVRLSWTNEA